VQVEVALVAARAMGMLGSDEGYGIALQGAKSQDPQQRFLAALALGAIGRTDAQEPLRGLLTAQEPNVRLAAATAILQLNAKV
jgi:HEAT repeat protein